MHNTLILKARSAAAGRRAKRFLDFIHKLPRPVRVIDLGGSAEMWARWGVTKADRLLITLVNNHHIDKSHLGERVPGNFISERQMDVMELSKGDLASYDVVFSNSMLEHLSSEEEQIRLAASIADCGQPYFVQVPNKHCIVDPHFPHPLAPFFAAWPRPLQVRMLTLHRLSGGNRCASPEEAMRRLHYYTPLNRHRLRQLFPGATIAIERTFGLPLSLVAMSPKP